MLQLHKQLEKGPQLTRNKKEMMDLVMSYVFSSHFLQYLRHKYGCFLHLEEEEKKNLIKSAEIFRIKQGKATVIINYNQPTISVLIYGELKCKQRAYNKGDYFMTGEEKLQVQFTKKTSMVMLNKMHFQNSLSLYEQFYYKKTIMEKILPADILGFKKTDYQFLNQHATIVSEANKYSQVINQKSIRYGVFVLFQGIFQIINKKNIKLTEITGDYFGEQSLWNDDYEFLLRPASYQFKYMFFPKAKFLQTVNLSKINVLKQFYAKKRELLLQIENKYEQNLQFTKLFLQETANKKIKRKFVQKNLGDKSQFLGQITRKLRHSEWKLPQSKKQLSRSQYYSAQKKGSQNLTCHQINPFYDSKMQSKEQLHKRAQTVILFKKSAPDNFEMTGRIEPSFSYHTRQRIKKARSYGQCGFKQDKTNLQGKINEVKMKRYHTLKAISTLKRGEIILKIPYIAQIVNRNFSKFEKTLKNSTKVSNLHASTYCFRTTTRSKSQNLKREDKTWR